MSDRVSVPRCLLAVLAALATLLALVAASAVTAQADPYGEIESFGEAEIQTPEKAVGVDPETGNVYVVDRDEHSFKILDFSGSGGKSIASAVFTPKVVTGQQDLIEGVAIDPSLHRLYVLALVTRREEPDQEITAASALYSFSTVPSAKTLEPAAGTEKTGSEKAILTNQSTLQPTSKEFGVSLLEPGGIAVDPTTHDILITGTIDRGKLSKVGAEEEEEYVKETTITVQRIHSNGEFGARYIDSKTEDLEECEALCINSPVVSSTGNVYVDTGEGDELEEFPDPASAKVPPETVTVTPLPEVKFNIGCASECRFGTKLVPEFQEKLTEMPAELGGGASNLAISPEGTLWARARVQYQLNEPGKGFYYGGALEFSSTFGEDGWTGGQSVASAAEKCVIDDLVEVPAVAAGKEGTLFVLDRSPVSAEEKRGPRIIELGSGGSGCPHGEATLSASVDGLAVAENEPVSIVDAVTLSSQLTQANALSVEWEFGDGTTKTVSTREQQTVTLQHTFAETGDLTIKEKIHTDNLAAPTIELTRKIDIVGPPNVITEEAAQVEGTSATLKGTVNPNEQEVTECKFEYGETIAYGSSAPCTPSSGFTEPREVSAKVSGLTNRKLYHFRLVATNKSGTEKGSDKTFTTETKPTAETEAASLVGQNSATLHAMVNPEGGLTECKFEYGTTTSYGSHVSCASSPGSGTSPVAVSASLTGLSASTTYHFRIVAESSGVPSYGQDKTFTTEQNKQRIEEEEAARRHQEEEEAAARRHQEEEVAVAATRKHQEEEAAVAAAKKHQEEEAAAQKKREEEAKAKAKPPTRAQLLAKALKTCKKGSKKKRAKCEAAARKKYGSKAKAKKK
jgi:DNA-binding beta-propeller fold protein YncE